MRRFRRIPGIYLLGARTTHARRRSSGPRSCSWRPNLERAFPQNAAASVDEIAKRANRLNSLCNTMSGPGVVERRNTGSGARLKRPVTLSALSDDEYGITSLFANEIAYDRARRPERKFSGLPEVVSVFGRRFERGDPPPRRGGWYRGKRQCFRNAFLNVLTDPSRFVYVEGLCKTEVSDMLIHHAWFVERQQPMVALDTTWSREGTRTYFGVPIKWQYMSDMVDQASACTPRCLIGTRRTIQSPLRGTRSRTVCGRVVSRGSTARPSAVAEPH